MVAKYKEDVLNTRLTWNEKSDDLDNILFKQNGISVKRLSSINDVDTSPVDWSVCNEKLGLRFSVVPYYLIVIKDGIIPPKYITKIT